MVLQSEAPSLIERHAEVRLGKHFGFEGLRLDANYVLYTFDLATKVLSTLPCQSTIIASPNVFTDFL